jgi:hypothetical protein
MMLHDLTRDLALSLDPVAFAAAAGITPDDWQQQLLRSSAPRILMNITRQGGKSTTAGVLALHTALYEPGSLVLMVSPTQRQSGELFRKALAIYRTLGRPVDAESESALQLELENGSRMVALPGKEGSIRSFSGVRLLLIDEASRVADDLYYSVRPMLAVSQGRLVTLSTPFGTRGWWYEAWRGAETWERYEVPATDCPRIPASFLEEEQRTLGEFWYRQEYLCEFLDAASSAFRREDIDRIVNKELEEWDI